MPDVTQREFDRPFYVSGVVATDGTNATLVTITVRNANGRAVGPVIMDIYLSDLATGGLLTATTASGAVAGKTNGTTGTDLVVHVAKKALCVLTLAAGTYQLSITDTAKTAFKIFAQVDGIPSLVATLSAASYG
jgi:hypothetical protein